MKTLTLLTLLLSSTIIQAQYEYVASAENPFGRLSPAAPPQTADYNDLIGTCECKSTIRIDQSTWADTVAMYWTFKYIMNGMAVQDETLKEDGGYSGSIRQFNADSSTWYVHYFASSTPVNTLPAWEGNKTEDGEIILYREQKAPNGMDGFYKIRFYDISKKGFNWIGAWVNPDETIMYPTWKIFCVKKE